MFDKLFEIFNKVSPEQPKSSVNRESIATPLVVSDQVSGQGTLLGFDYMKRPLDEEKEVEPRRFPILSEFLRGRYK